MKCSYSLSSEIFFRRAPRVEGFESPAKASNPPADGPPKLERNPGNCGKNSEKFGKFGGPPGGGGGTLARLPLPPPPPSRGGDEGRRFRRFSAGSSCSDEDSCCGGRR